MRRRPLLMALPAGLLATLADVGRGRAAAKRVRSSASTPDGKAMLAVYADGVKAMKARPATDPLSWEFQWYVHATPTDKTQLIATKFGGASSPQKSLAEESWYTCQSHLGQPEDYFLPWHRLFLLQFEAIIAQVTGKADFSLPYWDYTLPSAYAIPEEFRTSSSTNPKWASLFVANRNKGTEPTRAANVNAGEPLNKNFPGTRNFLVLPDVKQAYTAFSTGLDNNLHGNVHVFTGTPTNMGRIPFAAGDPVFWLHHCNIDRIWSYWEASGGKHPTATNGKAWNQTNFVFAGPDGKRVSLSISSIAAGAGLPYQYDSMPGPLAPLVLAQAGSESKLVLERSLPAGATAMAVNAAAPVALSANPVRVPLSPVNQNSKLSVIAQSLQPNAASRVRLVLKGVRVSSDPGVVYLVYLNLPNGASGAAADDHYVGLLNFFGLTEHSAHAPQDVEFDVTDTVQHLKAQGKIGDATSVTIVPSGAPADQSKPEITGGIELVR